MNGNKDSSLIYYRIAFKQKKPLAREIYNAAVVAAELRRFSDVSVYLTDLLQLGVSKEELKNIVSFQQFFKSKFCKVLFATKHQVTYNVAYRESIERLIKRDQLFRKTAQSYNLYSDTIKSIDKENITEFLSLVKKLGFPTEGKIGILNLEGLAIPVYAPIIIHQSAGSWQQFDFAPLLKENIWNGNVENKAGFYMLNRATGGNFFDIV